MTHYFPPEIGAPQARLFEMARRLVAEGVAVTVVTGFPNYPSGVVANGYRGRFSMAEDIDGVRVLRTWVYATPNRGFARRLVNHASFALSSLLELRKVGRVDLIFVESPPLAIGVAALGYSWLKRAPFVFNVSDIWPQSAIEMGAVRNRAAIAVAERFELMLYRRAARVSVVTPGMIDKLTARGVDRQKLFLLTNAVDNQVFKPATPDVELARRIGVEGRTVFLYAGTHGLAQGLEVVLEAARLTSAPEILYVLAGDGAEKVKLVGMARERSIENVLFLPTQPRDVMPALLNLAYATLVPLRRLDIFAAALPSKMFESMACARPIVIAVAGEAARLVEDARCGVVVPPEDPAALRDAVEALAGDPERAGELGANGRRYAIENFDRAKTVRRLLELIQEVAPGLSTRDRLA